MGSELFFNQTKTRKKIILTPILTLISDDKYGLF
jgi:hypothetical protein